MIEVEALGKRYGDRAVVEDVSFEVGEGELLVLVGPSGCGKTTTLKMINRLVEPTTGRVRISGQDTQAVPAHLLRRRIGYGFQNAGLFPHLTLAENIGVTPRLLDWPAARIAARVDALLSLVQLEPGEFRDRHPEGLSGGEQQRVSLARALAAEPDVLLLDEPFGALDPLTRDHLQQALITIRRELGVTIVFVTHDMLEALLLADRIAVLDEGRILQLGPPAELFERPSDPRITALLDTPRRQAERVDALLPERHPGAGPGDGA